MAWARCELCGRMDYCDVHHVFGGTRRQIAERLGATVTLCQRCHDKVHEHPAQYAWLKDAAQRSAMERNGLTLDDWLEQMGKNWLM